jgi:hypothetical protein
VLVISEILTTRVHPSSNEERSLAHLQDCKEAFSSPDLIALLMRVLMENMEDNDDEEARDAEATAPQQDQKMQFVVLSLFRNLLCVPDPSPGDAGFTMARRHMHLSYLRCFHEEGFMDYLLLACETATREDEADAGDEHAWAVLDILYHVATHVDPEGLANSMHGKNRNALGQLLQRGEVSSKLRGPPSSRHPRFGTTFLKSGALGTPMITTSVHHEDAFVTKGQRAQRKEYRDPAARINVNSTKVQKTNLYHDPFFVDLLEGSVRDHHQLNPHYTQGAPTHLDPEVMDGFRKFFDEFIHTSFSPLITFMRAACTGIALDPSRKGRRCAIYDRPEVLNFTTWILEAHRQNHHVEVAKARKANDPEPALNVTDIQGALELEMVQFATARLKEYSKQCNFHPSFLVITLRFLSQMLKLLALAVESTSGDIKKVGEVVFMNIVKEDAIGYLTWILMHFKSSSHDPRILSYTVEVYHLMLRLMTRIGDKNDFQVERIRGVSVMHTTTSVSSAIGDIADARVIDNLYYLLTKYKCHSPQLNSMLVKLIYQIIKHDPVNVVIFFELKYFFGIYRIVSDPLVKDKKMGKRYQEMTELLRFVLRQFFKCAEKNKHVFVEALFRKIPENPKTALIKERADELMAILDNYETEDYTRVSDMIGTGGSLQEFMQRQQAVEKGTISWTAQEDQVLRDRFPMYQDHPLCIDLLTVELPDESHGRTKAQVRKRLEFLGLITIRKVKASDGGGQNEDGATKGITPGVSGNAASDDKEVSPAKRQRLETTDAVQTTPFVQMETTQVDDESLEMDLERLLDAAIDSDPLLVETLRPSHTADGSTAAGAAPMESTTAIGATAAGTTAAEPNTADDSQDIEAELQRMLDLDTQTQPTQPETPPRHVTTSAAPAEAAAAPAAATSDEVAIGGSTAPAGASPQPCSQLTQDLEDLVDKVDFNALPSQLDPADSCSQSLEMDLERIMDEMADES